MKKFIYNDEEYNLVVRSYADNDRLCLMLENEDGYCAITTNISPLPTKNKEYVFINDLCKHSGLEELLINEGILTRIDAIPFNYEVLDFVKVDLDKIKEYDPNGFKEFLSYQEKNKSNFNEIIDENKIKDFIGKDNYVIVIDDDTTILIDKKDVPSYIVSRNKDLLMYDTDGEFLLTTIGCFLDKIDYDYRKEIIDELVDLQFGKIKPNNINYINSSLAEIIKNKDHFDNNKSIKI